jgi:hypothetical protein
MKSTGTWFWRDAHFLHIQMLSENHHHLGVATDLCQPKPLPVGAFECSMPRLALVRSFRPGCPQEIHLQQVDWNVLCTWKVLSNYGKSQNPFSFPCRRGMILPVQLLVSNSSCHPMESKRARSTYNCIPFGVVKHGWWEIPN